MRTDDIFLVGSGGHALVVLDTLEMLGVSTDRICIVDQSPAKTGTIVAARTVMAYNVEQMAGASVHVCIGNNEARARLADELLAAGCSLMTVIDPRAIVSRYACIGAGTFVAAGAIVATNANVGRACIINHGAIVDHECQIGDDTHIAPSVTLAGAVRIGSRTLVGAGANIIPGVKVHDDITIGAGSVVTTDLIEHGVYVGVPARKVKSHA